MKLWNMSTRSRSTYSMKAGAWVITNTKGNTANGTFSDTGLKVELGISMSIKNETGGKIQVTVTNLNGGIGSLSIKLSEGTGWWPGLFDKVTNWIANTAFFQDLVKSHINDGLNQPGLKDFLSGVINGALNKL